MKTLIGLAAVAAATTFITPAIPAHAETSCGYAGPNNAVRVSAGNDVTSCDFARAVANAEMSSQHSACSDVTQQCYTFTCMIERHGSTTCRGGNDFEVIVY
jgi:hypothetical protein